VRPANVPRYDELSVANLIKEVMANKDFAKFFPEQRSRSDLPEREYFFNIINTIEPDYLFSLIKHAQNLRFSNTNPDENKDIIEVNEFWRKELEASPYFSSKLNHFKFSRKTWKDTSSPEKVFKKGSIRFQKKEGYSPWYFQRNQGRIEKARVKFSPAFFSIISFMKQQESYVWPYLEKRNRH
jgi:hypothetical protein